MKTFCLKLSFLLIASIANLSSANAQLADQFSDGNFTDSPAWNGDTASWRVDEHFRLKTRENALSRTVYLSTPAPISKSAKWEFLLQMNFDPSASNRYRIYLSSTRANLSGPLIGYFLQIGESGPSDGYDLYRQDSLAVTRILEGAPVSRASDTLRCRFRIRRDTSGAWEISADPSGGHNFTFYGFTRDALHATGGYFGLQTHYTATRSGKFFFDDLLVSDQDDAPVIPPAVAQWGTILITEVMPDPTPAKGLPGAEYVEFYNPTDSTIGLRDWTWSDGRTSASFENASIAAGNWLIVCHPTDTTAFAAYGPVAGLSPFPSLNNTGDRLKLRGPFGVLIDSLNYSDRWYDNPYMNEGVNEGGQSLERIARSLPCLPRANWGPSLAEEGGTPGSRGSLIDVVNRQDFLLQTFHLAEEQRLELVFSGFPHTNAVLSPGIYTLNNGASIAHVELIAGGRGVALTLKESLRRGRLYRLSIRDLTDCYGNPLQNSEREFLLPQRPEPGDVVINEILFNPVQGGTDYVEIYNRSEKILDLKGFQLSAGQPATDPSGGTPSQPAALADSTSLFYPGEYRLLTRHPQRVGAHHLVRDPGVTVPMNRFPAFYNESGSCVLSYGDVLIDRMDYREDMHATLITDPEGISLEKIHFDLPASQNGVFRSAAATAGYGTPGYRNSQFMEGENTLREIFLANPVFSPRNGSDAWLRIRYHFPEPGLVAAVQIFDAAGRPVRRLAANLLLGTDGIITWNGRNDHDQPLQTGLYIIYMTVYSTSGWTERFREACVLSAGL